METLTFKQRIKCILLAKLMQTSIFNGITDAEIDRINDIADKLATGQDAIQTYVSDMPLDTPIRDCGLSVRTTHALDYAGITTVGCLIQRTERDLTKLRLFGKTSLKEIRNFLKHHHLQMKGEMI